MDIRYAKSTGEIDIAYTVIGDGPVDLVYVSGFITHLDLSWELPHFAWLQHLDGIARVITFDKRGTGLSDRSLGFGSIEERADDVRAVMDAAGSDTAVLMGVSEGGPMSILVAASSPERVRGLILSGTGARFSMSADYPYGVPEEDVEGTLELIRAAWGTGRVFDIFLQHPPDPEAALRFLARFERNSCTPAMAVEIMRRNLEIDVRPALSAVTAPTLVLHQTGDPAVPVESARYLADRIPGARLHEMPGDFHGSWRGEDSRQFLREVLQFLGAGGADAGPVDRILATILFTDITGSTQLAGRIGDSAWHELLDQHDSIAARHIDRCGGRMISTTGDGVLARFDGPARGIQCAQEIAEGLRPLGVRIRAGVHTGEVELRGGDVTGLGVVIARRVCDLASGDEVLVSRTVKDLVVGSQISFTSRGVHSLKGLAEHWELYAVSA